MPEDPIVKGNALKGLPVPFPPSSYDTASFRDELPFKIFDEVSRLATEVIPGSLGLLDFGDKDRERPERAYGVRLAVVVNISLRNLEAIIYPVLEFPLKRTDEVPVSEVKTSRKLYAQTSVRYTCFPKYIGHYFIPKHSYITDSSLETLLNAQKYHPELEKGVAIDFYNNTAAKGFDVNREDPYDEVMRRKALTEICKLSERAPPNPYSPPLYGRDEYFGLLAADKLKPRSYEQDQVQLGDLVLFDLRDLLSRGYIPGSLCGVRLGIVVSILGTKGFDDRFVELLPVAKDKSGLKDEVPIELQDGNKCFVEGNLAARWKLKNFAMFCIFRGRATQESFTELIRKRPFWECTKRRINTFDLLRLESSTNAHTFKSRPEISPLTSDDLDKLQVKDFDKIEGRPIFGPNHVADVEVGDLLVIDAGLKEDFIEGCVHGKCLTVVAKINLAKTYANIYEYPVTLSQTGDADEFEIVLEDGRTFFVQSRQIMRLDYPSAEFKIEYVGRTAKSYFGKLTDEARMERSYLTPPSIPDNDDSDNRIDWLKHIAEQHRSQ